MRKTIIIIAAALACSPAHALTNNEHGTTIYDQSTTVAPVANGGTGIGIGQGGSSVIESGAIRNSFSPTLLNLSSNWQSMTGSNNNTNAPVQSMDISYRYEAKDYIAPLTQAPSGDTRPVDLQVNQAEKMVAAAAAEDEAMFGIAMLSSEKHTTKDGVDITISYDPAMLQEGKSGCRIVKGSPEKFAAVVHAAPSGSARKLTGVEMSRIVLNYIRDTFAGSLYLYISPDEIMRSIEAHSKGTGAGLSNSATAAAPARGLVDGFSAAISGNAGRTSQRVRTEFSGRLVQAAK